MIWLSDDDYELAINQGLVGERDAPNNPKFRKSGYSTVMIDRYRNTLPVCRNRVVLDVGSGLGWGVNIVSDEATKVYGIDYDNKIIKFCNDNYSKDNVVFKCMDCRTLDFASNSIDVVLLMEVIEHFTFKDGYKIIEEIARVLTSTGTLIGTTYIATSESDRINCLKTSSNDHHLYIYTKPEMNILLSTFFHVYNTVGTINFSGANPKVK